MALEALQDYQNRAKRDQRLLNLQYRYAMRRGDAKGAMQAAQTADQMGLPVGRPHRIEETLGSAKQTYGEDMEMAGQTPVTSALDEYDPRHSSQGGQGVGYDFSQRKRTPLAPMRGPAAEVEPDATESLYADTVPGTSVSLPPVGGYDNRQQSVSPLASGGMTTEKRLNNDRRAAFSRAWQSAQTQEDRDMLVERAHGLGVPMNAAAAPSLERKGLIESSTPKKSLSYLDSPEFAKAKRGFDALITAAGPKISDEELAHSHAGAKFRNQQIDRDISKMETDSAEFSARLRAQPGFDDPDAYAAGKIAELDEFQRRADPLIGQHQSDLRRDIRLDETNRDRVRLPVVRGINPNLGDSASGDVLNKSLRRFGNKDWRPARAYIEPRMDRSGRQTKPVKF